MQNKNLKHSPGIHYPLGEPVTMENGEPGVKLVMKKQTEILNAREYVELLFGKEFWSYYLFFFR